MSLHPIQHINWKLDVVSFLHAKEILSQTGARAKVICARNEVCIVLHKLHSLKTKENVTMVLNVSKCWFNTLTHLDCFVLNII